MNAKQRRLDYRPYKGLTAKLTYWYQCHNKNAHRAFSQASGAIAWHGAYAIVLFERWRSNRIKFSCSIANPKLWGAT